MTYFVAGLVVGMFVFWLVAATAFIERNYRE